jgi:hypothetical protein
VFPFPLLIAAPKPQIEIFPSTPAISAASLPLPPVFSSVPFLILAYAFSLLQNFFSICLFITILWLFVLLSLAIYHLLPNCFRFCSNSDEIYAVPLVYMPVDRLFSLTAKFVALFFHQLDVLIFSIFRLRHVCVHFYPSPSQCTLFTPNFLPIANFQLQLYPIFFVFPLHAFSSFQQPTQLYLFYPFPLYLPFFFLPPP